MKKDGILNQQLSEIVASLGQSDMIVISDAGLPIPDECIRVDLAVVEGVPGFFCVLESLLKEIVVEKAILASECQEKSPSLYDGILQKIAPIRPQLVSHEDFKKMCKNVKAIIRTGEFTPYANIALVCGCICQTSGKEG